MITITNKLKQLREDCGFLADGDLYDFAEAVVRRIVTDLEHNGTPLSSDQWKVVDTYIPLVDHGVVMHWGRSDTN